MRKFLFQHIFCLLFCCLLAMFPTSAISDQKKNVEISQLAWSPNEQKVALIETGKRLSVVSRKSGRPIWQTFINGISMKSHDIGTERPTHALFWSPRGNRLALAYISQNGNLTLKVFENSKPIGSSSVPIINSKQSNFPFIFGASWSPDGKHIGLCFRPDYDQAGSVWIFSSDGRQIMNNYTKSRSFYWLGKGIAFYTEQGIKVVANVGSHDKVQSSPFPLKISEKAGDISTYTTKTKNLYTLQRKVSKDKYELERLSCYKVNGRSQRLLWFREFKVQRREGGNDELVVGENGWVAAYLIYATDGSSSGMTWCVSKKRIIDIKKQFKTAEIIYNIVPLRWSGNKLLLLASFVDNDMSFLKDEYHQFDSSTLKHHLVKKEVGESALGYWPSPNYRLKAKFSLVTGQIRMQTTSLY